MEDRMTPAEHATWTERRKMGFWWYIIRHGLLTRGARIGLIAYAVKCAGVLRKGSNARMDWLLDSLLIAIIYGTIMAWIEWSSSEGRYAEGPELDDPEPAVDCLKCGTLIPAGETCCPACGWTFEENQTTSREH